MNREAWMLKEIKTWQSEGLLSPNVAEKLLSRYSASPRSRTAGMVLVSAFGATLIGLGIITLFAVNWSNFSREVRAALAITPVILCGLTAIVAHLLRWRAVAFWEPLGVLWCIAVGAATCLVAQTYQVGGTASGLILFTSLLVLPVVWVTRATLPMTSWPLFAIVWTFSQSFNGFTIPLCGLALLALSLPAYIAFIRRPPENRPLFVIGQTCTGAIYLLGACTLLCSALADDLPHTLEVCLSIFWGGSILFFLLARVFNLPYWRTIAIAVLMVSAQFSVGAAIPFFMVALLIAALAVAHGIWKHSLVSLNAGLALASLLVLSKFFQSSLELLPKGLILIATGAVLVSVNAYFARNRKKGA